MSNKQKKATVDGQEYTLQHPGAMWYLEMVDECKNATGVLQVSKYTQKMFENVVVQPKVTVEDFEDDLKKVNNLLNEVEDFVNGGKK